MDLEEILDECFDKAREVLPKALAYMSSLLGEVSAKSVEKHVRSFLESVPHVIVHEAAHAYAERLIEGLGIPEGEKRVLEEVLARFIERKTSAWLREQGYSWVLVETLEEQVRELEAYPEFEGIGMSVEKYAELYRRFEESLEEGELGRYVDSLAKELRLLLR